MSAEFRSRRPVAVTRRPFVSTEVCGYNRDRSAGEAAPSTVEPPTAVSPDPSPTAPETASLPPAKVGGGPAEAVVSATHEVSADDVASTGPEGPPGDFAGAAAWIASQLLELTDDAEFSRQLTEIQTESPEMYEAVMAILSNPGEAAPQEPTA